jgi:hypothetical protein
MIDYRVIVEEETGRAEGGQSGTVNMWYGYYEGYFSSIMNNSLKNIAF